MSLPRTHWLRNHWASSGNAISAAAGQAADSTSAIGNPAAMSQIERTSGTMTVIARVPEREPPPECALHRLVYAAHEPVDEHRDAQELRELRRGFMAALSEAE